MRIARNLIFNHLIVVFILLRSNTGWGDVSASISKPAVYYSGTYCAFSAHVQTSLPGSYIVAATMYVNGVATKSYTWQPGDNFIAWGGPLTFDSTHFPDGQGITVGIDAYNNYGERGSVTNPAATVYNKAFVYGNVVPGSGGIGDLFRGYDFTQTAAGNFASANHTVQPASPTTAVNQTRGMINSNMAWSTAFAFYSHGNPGQCGDSAEILPAGQWVTTTDIASAMATKTSGQPPVNFVFADSCKTGADGSVAYAFQVAVAFGPQTPDRAFLGWTVDMQDNLTLISWTNKVFQRLLAGDSIDVAVQAANVDPGRPLDFSGNPADAKRYGDTIYKLRGVYGQEGSVWWK